MIILFEPCAGIYGAFLGRGETYPGRDSHAWRPLLLKQIHGDVSHVIRRPEDTAEIQGREGDALITDLPNLPLAVRSADCLPIFLAHPQGVIAAIHAGWRGSLAEITKKTLRRMSGEFSLDPRETYGVIGPAICGHCFEIGAEVAHRFQGLTGNAAWLSSKGTKYLLDLKMMNREQMLAGGMLLNRIEIRPECTLCREGDYFSFRGATSRGERNEGRNLSWIALSEISGI